MLSTLWGASADGAYVAKLRNIDTAAGDRTDRDPQRRNPRHTMKHWFEAPEVLFPIPIAHREQEVEADGGAVGRRCHHKDEHEPNNVARCRVSHGEDVVGTFGECPAHVRQCNGNDDVCR